MQNSKLDKHPNIILQKSFDLAIRTVNLYKFLKKEKREYILSKQLLRSGTSIGANVREAVAGYSKADFRAKISIAQKEANETEYWIQLLFKTNFVTEKEYTSFFNDVNEVNKILSKILITSGKNKSK